MNQGENKIKIVLDSSANLLKMADADFSCVPLKITTEEKEYVDNEKLNVPQMLMELKDYKGKSSTACPGIGDWIDAFGDAEFILGAALTSKISGCYNAAIIAAEQYLEEYPDRKVFILDSLTTGPELELIAEKYEELQQKPFDDIVREIQDYQKTTGLLFMLGSLENFAKNGRVSPAVAKLTGMLNIRIVGRASAEGELEPLHKCRGDKGSMEQIWKCLCEAGYQGGKVRIRHTENESAARRLENIIHSVYPAADVTVSSNRGLCSFYAESGGVLVGFEGCAPETSPNGIRTILSDVKTDVRSQLADIRDDLRRKE